MENRESKNNSYEGRLQDQTIHSSSNKTISQAEREYAGSRSRGSKEASNESMKQLKQRFQAHNLNSISSGGGQSLHSSSLMAYKRPEASVHSVEELVASRKTSLKRSNSFESVSISEESEKQHKLSQESLEQTDEEFERHLKCRRSARGTARVSARGSARGSAQGSVRGSARGSVRGSYDEKRETAAQVSKAGPQEEQHSGESLLVIPKQVTTFDRRNESCINPETLALLKASQPVTQTQINGSLPKGNEPSATGTTTAVSAQLAKLKWQRNQSLTANAVANYGLRKLGNIGDAMSTKVQKQMENLGPQERTIVRALKRDRDGRNYVDNEELVKYFSTVNSFEQHGIDGNDLLKVIQCMYYLFVPKKTVLFRYKDEGDVFYVIVSGKIQLWLPNPEIEGGRYAKKDLEAEVAAVDVELAEYDGIDLTKTAVNQDNVNRLKAKKKKLELDIEVLIEQITTCDEMVPVVVLGDRTGFGEKSLLSDQGRAGTCVTKEDCHLAVVTKESYKKLLLKSQQAEQQEMVAFLRQIPFLLKWKQRELISLKYFLKITKLENRGQYLCREGEPCEKFIIVKSGEFEIVKTDLRNVFYNTSSGIVGIKEENAAGKIIRSTNPILSTVAMIENTLGQASSHQYLGTEFQTSIQAFLNTQVSTKQNFKEAHRSKFNQPHIKEVKVAIIGQAHTFGDVDASRGRKHMYSLRTTSRNCEVYEIDAREFLTQVKTKGRHHDLAAYVKAHDQQLVNKFAKNLQLMFEGMNIDGVKTEEHEYHEQQKLRLDTDKDALSDDQDDESVCSPTAGMLGDQSQVRLRRQISMASIEQGRRLTSQELGYAKDRGVARYGEKLPGFTGNLPCMDMPRRIIQQVQHTDSTNQTVTNQTDGTPKKKITVIAEYTDQTMSRRDVQKPSTQQSERSQKNSQRNSQKSSSRHSVGILLQKSNRNKEENNQKVEAILAMNPGNFQRKRPITVVMSDFIDNSAAPSEAGPPVLEPADPKSGRAVKTCPRGVERSDSASQITNGDRLRVMTNFQHNNVPSVGAISQLKTLFCRDFDKRAIHGSRATNKIDSGIEPFPNESGKRNSEHQLFFSQPHQQPRKSLSPESKLRALCREERKARGGGSGERPPAGSFRERRTTAQPSGFNNNFGHTKGMTGSNARQIASLTALKPNPSVLAPNTEDADGYLSPSENYGTSSHGIFDDQQRPNAKLMSMKNKQSMINQTVLKPSHPIHNNRPYQSLRQAQANAIATSAEQLNQRQEQMNIRDSNDQGIYKDMRPATQHNQRGRMSMQGIGQGIHQRKNTAGNVYYAQNPMAAANLLRPQSVNHASSQRIKQARRALEQHNVNPNAHITGARDANSVNNMRFQSMHQAFDYSMPTANLAVYASQEKKSSNSNVNISFMESTNPMLHHAANTTVKFSSTGMFKQHQHQIYQSSVGVWANQGGNKEVRKDPKHIFEKEAYVAYGTSQKGSMSGAGRTTRNSSNRIRSAKKEHTSMFSLDSGKRNTSSRMRVASTFGMQR